MPSITIKCGKNYHITLAYWNNTGVKPEVVKEEIRKLLIKLGCMTYNHINFVFDVTEKWGKDSFFVNGTIIHNGADFETTHKQIYDFLIEKKYHTVTSDNDYRKSHIDLKGNINNIESSFKCSYSFFNK